MKIGLIDVDGKEFPNLALMKISAFHKTNANQIIPKWQQDMARWCNHKAILKSCDFKDYEPRIGFYCREYFK